MTKGFFSWRTETEEDIDEEEMANNVAIEY